MKSTVALVVLLLVPALTLIADENTGGKTQPLVPAGWDAALAGDLVLDRLVRVSAPQVKGAHDAEFVCVADRAYIVEHDNDVQPGHGAGRKMYCVLSVVNLKTLKVERTILLARSAQKFTNTTLPAGACFVPRILQLNDQTLRCYFASEDGSRREAQTWYRDFDLRTQAFEGGIHKVKLKTAAGVFDMQPRYFHADAKAQGFNRPPKRMGLYLFDSFKQFDGKTYVAINNWPGKQNALAVAHDDRATFEVVGHFNEPQSQQLSEAAVNRLPDGTWMAICRNDKGNYHFTTSANGRKWSVAKEMPFVPNGLNSKPTFDRFAGVYYLGWQENTQVGGCRRSVFNVDISRDGETWQRKYRFETADSFQYPTFHQHNGAIWLSVSQSDHGGTSDRIMFGKLEDTGAFASQKGLARKPMPPPVMKPGVKLFTDRSYTLIEAPEVLLQRRFLRTSIEGYTIECVEPGDLYVMTLSKKHHSNRSGFLLDRGFKKVATPEFQLFQGDLNRVFAYRKHLKQGDKLTFNKLAFSVLGDGLQIKLAPAGAAKSAAVKLPAFTGPTPGVSRKVNMPLVDLSSDRKRHAVVAAGTDAVYQGHCDTVLLPDGKTMYTAWCLGHARWIGPVAKSTDAGLTWSKPLAVPENWQRTSNTPALHRLVAPDGTARLFCFADGLDWSRQGKPPYPMHQSYSTDAGKTWTPMAANGVQGEVPPKTILSFDQGKRHLMWSDLPGYVVQSESRDGGLTWSASRRILRVPDRWSQPCVIRSADGRTHLMLLRENSGKHQSLFSVSHDNAKTWTAPRELPAALTGHRHVAKSTPGGRLVVAFRDMCKSSSTYGHYVAWVGSFEDIVAGRPGSYRIKLFHNALRNPADNPGQGNTDCGYSDLELLPTGAIVATTYLKYAPGPSKHSVMNTRFTLAETDALVAGALIKEKTRQNTRGQ